MKEKHQKQNLEKTQKNMVLLEDHHIMEVEKNESTKL